MNEKTSNFSFMSFFYPLTHTKVLHILVLMGFLVFGNTLVNGFVWDDLSNILFNPQVQSFHILSGFEKSNVNQGLQFRPIVTLYFSSMYHLFKDMPFFYHFFNVVFHIINSILVYIILQRFFKIGIAFFLSLIFLIHPMQVESATWISTAGNVYFLFGMSGLLLGIGKRISLKRGIVIGALFFLSLLSKETGIVFPIMMVLYMFFWNKKDMWKSIGIGSMVILVYGFLRLFVTQVQFEAPLKIVPIARLTLGERLINVPEIIWYYFKTFFFPKDVVIMQYWVIHEKNFQQFYFPLLIDCFIFISLGLLGYYLYQYRKKNFLVFLFFFVWFLLGLLLHIHLSPLNMTVADRWFYFPMVGLLGLLAIGGEVVGNMWSNKKQTQFFWCVGITIIIVLSTRTIIRNADWRDDLTLYLHDREIQTNFNIENNIGWNYQQAKDWRNAQKYYKNSVELYPYYAISLNNLAYTYIVLKDQKKARTYFYNVLGADDYYPDAYAKALNFAAWMLLQTDTPDIAKDFTKKAIQKDATNASLWGYLAISEYTLHNQKGAEQAIEKGLSIHPSYTLYSLQRLIQTKTPIPKNMKQL